MYWQPAYACIAIGTTAFTITIMLWIEIIKVLSGKNKEEDQQEQKDL